MSFADDLRKITNSAKMDKITDLYNSEEYRDIRRRCMNTAQQGIDHLDVDKNAEEYMECLRQDGLKLERYTDSFGTTDYWISWQS